MIFIKKFASFALAFSFLLAAFFQSAGMGARAAGAAHKNELYDSYGEPSGEVYAQGVMLVYLDKDGDTTLYEHGADERAAPASLTKIVTACVALQNCDDPDSTIITASDRALSPLIGTGSSLSGIKTGEQLTMRQLLYCLMLPSGNDAAMIIADYIGGGDVQKFVGMMNGFAATLGCKNTRFANPHGLDEDGHYTTARDMYTITKYAMGKDPDGRENVPGFAAIATETSYTLPATNMNPQRTVNTTNLLHDPKSPVYYYSPVKGVKTGTTEKAGQCVVTTAEKDGLRYLCVAMNSHAVLKNGQELNGAFADTITLYQWAFASFKYKTIATAYQTAEAEVKVNLAWNVDHVRLVPQNDVYMLVPAEFDPKGVLIKPASGDPPPVDAPVKKGQVICEGSVMYANREIARVNLVAADSVQRSELLLAADRLKKITSSVWFIIAASLLGLLIVLYVILNVIYNRRKKKNRMKLVKNRRRI